MAFLALVVVNGAIADPSTDDVRAAMREASDFMANTVALHGGYLFNYSADLSEKYGEIPARPTQIWVQDATPQIGELFLDAWSFTGDSAYLDYARRAADALIYGQHPLGGWHYFIDFDMPGLDEWYEKKASRYKWGYEEYRHYYGNCTYDDNTTQGATRFLLRYYMATLDAAYREPLERALNFILISQYPNGAWPQRYPLRYEFVHDGLPDYTSLYTMNDNSMRDIIRVLVEAWEKLGNEEYLKAAKRGMDFMILAQGPQDQAGWAEQYDMNMRPAWARTHEIASYMPRQSVQVMEQLMTFYLLTGDRRYLSPIPAGINWLKSSSYGTNDDGLYQMARYYEPGTNNPLYQHKTDKVNEEGYGLYLWDNDGSTVSGGWNYTLVDIDGLSRQYENISTLTPEEARSRYTRMKNAPPSRPDIDPEAVEKLIEALDGRGAWIEDISVHDSTLVMLQDRPNKTIKGISTRRFRSHMRLLLNYLRMKEGSR